MSDPALLASVTFYSAGIYPRFDQMGFEAAKQAADFCGEWANEYPLWIRHTTGFLAKKSEFPQREIPGFGERSSIYAMAVMAAFLVWTQRKAGNELPGSELLEAADWGYKLCYGVKNEPKPNQETPETANNHGGSPGHPEGEQTA